MLSSKFDFMGELLSKKHDLTKTIEQKLKVVIGNLVASDYVKTTYNEKGILIDIKKYHSLITVNYNFYLPSKTEVNAPQPLTPLEEIKKHIKRRVIENPVEIKSHETKI